MVFAFARKATGCWAALAMIMLAGLAGAVEPIDVTDQGAPFFDVFGPQDGLSEEIWSAVSLDAGGFIWAGSASGLARFDGYRWQTREVPGASSLVRDLLLDDDGVLWALFESDGLARYDGQRWTLEQHFPAMRHLFALERSDGGRDVWLSYGHGLARLENGRWIPDAGNGPDTRDVIATARTEQLLGRPLQWLARYNGGGLWHRDVLGDNQYGPWQRAALGLVQHMALNSLATSRDRGREELWILSYSTGLARLDESGLTLWRAFDACGDLSGATAAGRYDCKPAALPTEAIYQAVATQGGDGRRVLWLATRAGLVHIRGDEIGVYDRSHGLPSSAVRGLMTHRVNGLPVLWMATEAGLARATLADPLWRTVSLLGSSDNGIFGVLIEPDGKGSERLWAGSSQRGLALLEAGGWRLLQRGDGGMPDDNVRALWRVTGPDDTSWRLVSFTDHGLYRLHDDLSFEALLQPAVDAGAPGYVDAVLSRQHDREHELWVGSFGNGVYRLRDGRWTRFAAPGGQSIWRVNHLLEQIDFRGRSWLWAFSHEGLARFDGMRWAAVEVAGMAWPDDSFLLHASLQTLPSGQQLWIGTVGSGVIRVDVTDPARPVAISDHRVPPAPDPIVYSVLADSRGVIYVCTNNGVQRLTPQTDGSYSQRVYRRSDGLVHDECNSNSQLVDRRDRYWAGTLGGLSLFDPGERRRQTILLPKPLHFTDLVVDGRSVQIPADREIRLPPGTRELRLEYALLAGLRERESLYRSQLGGFEQQPTDWTPINNRSFSGLAPGRYRFEVEAMDANATPVDPQRLTLVLEPHWWQRRSVQLMLGGALVLALFGGVRGYNAGLRRRQRQLRIEVAARTQQLQQANLRLTELSFQDPLTGLANRRRLIGNLSDELDRARQQDKALGLVMIDVDHFKRYNDRQGHVAGDVALRAIARVLEDATRPRDLVGRLGGEEFACLVVDADSEVVKSIAERMRRQVAELTPRDLGNERDRLTISAGVLVRVPRPGEAANNVLSDCDRALYRAKHEGRNRVCVFGPLDAVVSAHESEPREL